MEAGIVVYQRQGNQLVGQWSHENEDGKLAKEIVHDVAPGSLEGDWPVEIFKHTGELFYSGRLHSSKFGDCLKLVWEGKLTNGGPLRFEGIGYAHGDLVSATFELVKLPSLHRRTAPNTAPSGLFPRPATICAAIRPVSIKQP